MTTSAYSDLFVTEAQRNRGIDYLQQAYADGRLTGYEFDQRVGIVLGARTRAEMNVAFQGLARIPSGRGATPFVPRSSASTGVGARAGAGLAHLSATVSGPVGPAIAYGLTARGGYARREAAKAFNFQVVTLVIAVAAKVLLGGPVLGMVMALGTLGWLVLTLTGTARAFAGEDWGNPVTAHLPVRFLDEGDPNQKSLASSRHRR